MGSHHAPAEPRGKFIDPTTTPFLVDAEVTEVTKVYDGDTVHIRRQFTELVTDWTVTVTVDRYPLHARLVIVNTPELRTQLGPTAKADTAQWLNDRHGYLRARTYGQDDFGRTLTDIYDFRTGETLSGFLLGRGYPQYVPHLGGTE